MYRFIFLASFILVCLGFKEEPVSRLPWHRSFYAEMKALEKPLRVTAFAAVQTAANTTTFSSMNITLSPTTTGNLVVVSISIGAAQTVTSVTDNQGNTYAVSSPATGSTFKAYQAYAVQITGGVTTVTINLSGSVAIRACADEYSGTDNTSNANVHDVTASNTGTGTSASVSLTPSASGKLIVATLTGYWAETWTAGADYTLYGNAVISTNSHTRSMYRLSGTTSETAPATFTYDFYDQWQEVASSFNPYTAPTAAPALNAAGNKPK